MKKIINPFVNIEGYCCPGCCPTNERGLRLEFFEDGDDIVSYWTPDPNLQSWRNTLHGGIHCMMLDEVAGWVVFHKLQTVAVTSRMDIRYLKPITIDGGVVEMRARITKQVRQVSYIDAELIQGGEVCSKAQVIYFCHSRERSLAEYNFSGCETEE
ncbi:MAG: PaaI family thioesterase [Bacteroidaceae bacterium]|nr:PaaI family thioesterase [Bacteroidaceae bacterium]